MVTSAPIPTSTSAALVPTTPPPKTSALAGATPVTPPINIPLPPCGFSRYLAACCPARRPATSDIGAKSGNAPFLSSMVSYAMHVAPERSIASVSANEAAK